MPLTKINQIKYYANNNPLCPHCDHDIDVDYNDLTHLYNEGKYKIDCPSCGKGLKVIVDINYDFNTDCNL